MRALVQRVTQSSVLADNKTVAQIGQGLLVLLGVAKGDELSDAAYLARKVAHLRIFEDASHKLNLSLLDIGGEALVVSQFTLYGDCNKGLRPSFDKAAPAELAQRLYEDFVRLLKEQGICVSTGIFQADMLVNIANNGPVTIIIDSKSEKNRR
ncbi:MAG: D-aminoacyl-tRNA deacylase [Bacillota bacterium]|jgi:D-tyrosyl-tRNA(Tyr) deacylase